MRAGGESMTVRDRSESGSTSTQEDRMLELREIRGLGPGQLGERWLLTEPGQTVRAQQAWRAGPGAQWRTHPVQSAS